MFPCILSNYEDYSNENHSVMIVGQGVEAVKNAPVWSHGSGINRILL